MATDRHREAQDGGAYGSAAAAEGWRRGAAARAQFLDGLGLGQRRRREKPRR